MAGAIPLSAPVTTQAQQAQSSKPNILIIWGDDIGWFNPSVYHHGIMGYQTPNIDRLAKEGVMFTDWYGQQSCTAGRAAFTTGQSPIRTGLTKVGLPGADLGWLSDHSRSRKNFSNTAQTSGTYTVATSQTIFKSTLA